MPSYNEDMLGALFLIAAMYAVKNVTKSNQYYIVEFEDTTATLLIDGTQVSRTEIDACIAEARLP